MKPLPLCHLLVIVAVAAASGYAVPRPSKESFSGTRGKAVRRKRANIHEVQEAYGGYFDRAYRMSVQAFWELYAR